jgi:aldehyde dehydrogenase (NAD+)
MNHHWREDTTIVDDWGHFIDGALTKPGPVRLQEFDPSTAAASFSISRGGKPEIDRAVAAGVAAFPSWRDRRPAERGRILIACAETLRRNCERLGRIDRGETGRRLSHCLSEVETSAQYLEYYAGLVNAIGGRTIDLGAGYHSYTRHEPFGVIGIITPWNAPLTQAARGFAPAIAVGNTVVLKPSEFTSVGSLEMARLLFTEAGLPAGVLNVITGVGSEAGDALVRNESVRKVSFTGSLRAAREIGRIAAERILPIGLELGGKSANIVFADADFDAAIPSTVTAFCVNAGQACSAGSRLLVERSVHESFVTRLRKAVAEIRVGSSDDDFMGPIITRAQFEKVKNYRKIAADEGTEMFVGGNISSDSNGWFVPPVIMTGVTNDMRVAREEIFGPILAVIPFDTEADAVRIANDSEYGLVAGIWTRDLARAHRTASLLEVGQVFINEYYAGGVETPFGGYKRSGIGREKGIEAMHHYCQTKAVTVRL